MNRLIDVYRQHIEEDSSSDAEMDCKVHTSEHLSMYCETCKSLVCKDCIIDSCSRKNHTYGRMGDMVKKYSSEFEGELGLVRSLHQQVTSDIEALTAMEREMLNARDAKLQRIGFTFDALSECLEEERQFFIEAVEERYKEQEVLNACKRNEIAEVMVRTKTLLEVAETNFHGEPKPAFLAVITAIKDKIKRAKKSVEALSPHPDILPQTDIELMCPDKFRDLCHLKNFVHMKADPLRCHAERSLDLSKVQIHEITDITLYLNPDIVKRGGKFSSKEKSWSSSCAVSASLYCTHSGTSR